MELLIIQKKIYEVRGLKVMLDFDLAKLYEVETKILNQAVKRNKERFPERFMFRLSPIEWENMRSQIVTASHQVKRNIAVTPFAFTEHGVTMLASVLRSETAVKVSIAIVDAFILLKQYHNNYDSLGKRIDELEEKFGRNIENINEVIEFLLSKPEPKKPMPKPRKKIGFKLQKK